MHYLLEYKGQRNKKANLMEASDGPKSNNVYYWNPKTNEVSWVLPDNGVIVDDIPDNIRCLKNSVWSQSKKKKRSCKSDKTRKEKIKEVDSFKPLPSIIMVGKVGRLSSHSTTRHARTKRLEQVCVIHHFWRLKFSEM